MASNKCTPASVVIDGETYVKSAPPADLSEYAIIRADCGVFFGKLKERDDRNGTIENCRQLYYFKTAGVGSYLEVANSGVKEGSKLTSFVSSITLTDIRSVTTCTQEAATNLLEWPATK